MRHNVDEMACKMGTCTGRMESDERKKKKSS